MEQAAFRAANRFIHVKPVEPKGTQPAAREPRYQQLFAFRATGVTSFMFKRSSSRSSEPLMRIFHSFFPIALVITVAVAFTFPARCNPDRTRTRRYFPTTRDPNIATFPITPVSRNPYMLG